MKKGGGEGEEEEEEENFVQWAFHGVGSKDGALRYPI